MSELVLKGIDGANPLGFLAALGTLVTGQSFCRDIALFWRREYGAWRPVVSGPVGDEANFIESLDVALSNTSSEPFEFDNKLPFSAERFSDILKEVQVKTGSHDRRTADLLSSFGCEVFEKNGVFKDTRFRMVRSGDSKGQGFPFYAKSIRKQVGGSELRRTLFETWDYRDDGFSLRWAPMEDQRYALRWHDPSKKKDVHAPGTMFGANALAIEALALFPACPAGQNLKTTGFFKDRRNREFFTWPVWEAAASPEVVRSLVSLQELHEAKPDRNALRARGVVEIYRSERIAPNQYYRNFAAAAPAG